MPISFLPGTKAGTHWETRLAKGFRELFERCDPPTRLFLSYIILCGVIKISVALTKEANFRVNCNV